MSSSLSIYLIAGEASGDVLGAKLMQALISAYDGDIHFYGVGGKHMEKLGLKSLFPMKELSLIGFAEIIPHIPHLLNRITMTANDIKQRQPDMVVTIDAPMFCKRVVKKIQDTDILRVHYVAPTVWAYKPKRAQKLAKLYHHLLLLLPFEAPYFQKVGLECSFIGHPIIEDMVINGDGEAFRNAHDIPDNAPILCVMPGSREGEITRHMPIFSQTVKKLQQIYPRLYPVIITTSNMSSRIREETTHWHHVIVIDDDAQKADIFAASTAALVKSGTSTLEVALNNVPMVVAYKVNPLSAWLLRRMIKIRFVTIINLILGKEVIPECLQEDCTASNLKEKLLPLLEDEEIRNNQIHQNGEAMAQLGRDDKEMPSQKAAKTLLELLEKKLS